MAFATVKIKLNGKDLADQGIRPGNIVLRQPLWDHHQFQVECLSLVKEDSDAKGGASEALDGLHKGLGQEISIEAVWQGEKAEQGVQFKGIVTSVRAERALQGAYSVILEGASSSVRLDAVPRNRAWEEVSSADVLSQIMGEYPDTEVKDTPSGPTHPFVVQHGETDYRFLRRLCAREQLHLFYDGEKLVAAKDTGGAQESLTMGRAQETGALHRFSLRLQTRPGQFAMRSWNPAEDTFLVMKTSEVSLGGKLHPWVDTAVKGSDSVYTTVGDLEPEIPPAALADLKTDLTHYKESWAGTLVVGEGESDNLSLDPGTRLKVTGISEDQAGEFLITEITHYLQGAGQGYRNVFQCVPVESAVPPRLDQPPIQPEIWTGTVTDHNDPENAGRVKVELHHSLDSSGGWNQTARLSTWARVASPYAGESGAWLSTPEIGDEVLVASVEGDLHRPVILGSLVGPRKKNAAVEQIGGSHADSTKKVMVTRSGNHIIFDDTDGEETVTIGSPQGKNTVTLTLKSAPTIQLKTQGVVNLIAEDSVNVTAAKGITLETDKNFEVKAGGDIILKASGKLNAEATGNHVVKGMEVSVESAGGSVKAAASGVDIKGAMVKLN